MLYLLLLFNQKVLFINISFFLGLKEGGKFSRKIYKKLIS